jgi:acetyltransferase-like isoleucine patch superfamily enzyme
MTIGSRGNLEARLRTYLRSLSIALSSWRFRMLVTSCGRGTRAYGFRVAVDSGAERVGRGVRIGNNCGISDGCVFVTDDYLPGSGIVVGDNCHFNRGCYVSGSGGVDIGRDCLFGPYVTILSGGHNYADTDRPIVDQGLSLKSVRIENDVWVGARAVIMPGIAIGTGAVIGAGSVVTRSVSPFSVVAGNPAKEICVRK